MSRAMIPSVIQIDKLIKMLSKYRFLATGHARTAHARERNSAAWQKIGSVLNSEANGCIKSWQQWAKYWKDKKASLKRKVIQVHKARRHSGSGMEQEEEIKLTAVEDRLLALVGDSFAAKEPKLEEPEPKTNANGDSDSKSQDISSEIMETTERVTEILGRKNATSAASFPRPPYMTQERRRLLHRTPPAQQSSQIKSLMERVITVEERRVEVEMMHARTMESMSQSFDCIGQGFLQQSQALQSLAESIRIILERK